MPDNASDQPEKKIIIDEDWKSQVESEKEDLERKQQEGADTSAPPPEPEGPMPPPTLEVLASSLGMQAMIALGLIPNPVSGKPEVHLDQAKHFIDTIAMLENKTEGNRTPGETAVLGDLLHELRMGYLAVQQKPTES